MEAHRRGTKKRRSHVREFRGNLRTLSMFILIISTISLVVLQCLRTIRNAGSGLRQPGHSFAVNPGGSLMRVRGAQPAPLPHAPHKLSDCQFNIPDYVMYASEHLAPRILYPTSRRLNSIVFYPSPVEYAIRGVGC